MKKLFIKLKFIRLLILSKEVAISLITKDGIAEEDLLFLTEDSFLVENGEPEECYEEEKKKYENNDFIVKTKSNHVVVLNKHQTPPVSQPTEPLNKLKTQKRYKKSRNFKNSSY